MHNTMYLISVLFQSFSDELRISYSLIFCVLRYDLADVLSNPHSGVKKTSVAPAGGSSIAQAGGSGLMKKIGRGNKSGLMASVVASMSSPRARSESNAGESRKEKKESLDESNDLLGGDSRDSANTDREIGHLHTELVF
jgi:hypothetical protein